MIRAATYRDLERVKALLYDMYADSKYLGRGKIVDKVCDEVLAHALTKQKSPIQGGSFFHVAEHEEEVQGFMIGALDRIYHIGSYLVAQDIFLHVAKGGQPTDAVKLIRHYVEWARMNPRVLTINLSWTDTLPGAEKIEPVYERLGFKRSGGIFEMAVDQRPESAAAARSYSPEFAVTNLATGG